LVIRQEDDVVTIIYASGDTLTIVPDGKKRKRETLMGDVETTAIWKDFALEVTTKRAKGPETRYLYRISNEGRLEVVRLVELPSGEKPIEFVTRYDEVKNE
jgi:hypothetical protein